MFVCIFLESRFIDQREHVWIILSQVFVMTSVWKSFLFYFFLLVLWWVPGGGCRHVWGDCKWSRERCTDWVLCPVVWPLQETRTEIYRAWTGSEPAGHMIHCSMKHTDTVYANSLRTVKSFFFFFFCGNRIYHVQKYIFLLQLYNDPNIVIAKMDATDNDVPPGYDVEGWVFKTITSPKTHSPFNLVATFRQISHDIFRSCFEEGRTETIRGNLR